MAPSGAFFNAFYKVPQQDQCLKVRSMTFFFMGLKWEAGLVNDGFKCHWLT